MAKLSLIEVNSSRLESIPIKDGQLVLCTDDCVLYRDTSDIRIRIGDVIPSDSLPLAPLTNKLYLLLTDGTLNYYNDGWQKILSEQIIDTDTDLNNILESNRYYCPNGITISNMPDEKIDGFFLDVVRGGNYTLMQILISSNEPIRKIFIRTYWQKSSLWSDWDYVYTSAYPPSKSDIGLDKVENKSSSDILSEITKVNITDALGYTPPQTDTVYTLPSASSDVLGGIKTGFTQSDKNYPIVLNSNSQAYVNVPWTDTTYNTATTSANGLMSSLDKSSLDKITKQAAQKYELIETITVSEEAVTVISRTQEPDGTAYDFQKMKVYMTIPAQSGLAAAVTSVAMVNDVRAFRVSTLYNSSESKIALLRCKIESGYLSCEQTTTTSVTSIGFLLAIPIYTTLSSDIEADSINSFVFSNTNNTVIPVGSEFKIYAVRSVG